VLDFSVELNCVFKEDLMRRSNRFACIIVEVLKFNFQRFSFPSFRLFLFEFSTFFSMFSQHLNFVLT